ncbi:hypothetical protein [Bilophila wadsworthia]|uniref:hypothetical protein n=1 Tax=Bilophila wadsworthia TaxID=35833 RepID=UPI003520004A
MLELAVLFLLRWGRRNGSTAGLDGKFLNLVFAVQGLSFNSTELLKKILRLSALAYGLARKNGNKRFLALLMAVAYVSACLHRKQHHAPYPESPAGPVPGQKLF